MPHVRVLAVLLMAVTLTGFIGAGSNSDVIVAPGQRNLFPSVSGINLVGDTVALPDGFEGQLNLVVLGFEMDQQPDIDTWIATWEEARQSVPALRFYEVPVIGAGSAAFRLYVNNGMHFGILDHEARKRTVTIYVDRGKFNLAVGVSEVSRIHALLLDSAGHILWRGEGPANERSIVDFGGAVRRAVDGAQSQAGNCRAAC